MRETWRSYELTLLAHTAGAFAGLALLFGLVIMPFALSAQLRTTFVPCDTLRATVPVGFAPPVDLFGHGQTLLLAVSCSTGSVEVVAGVGERSLVYRTGYISHGGRWEPFMFAGSGDGEWISGVANARVPMTASGNGSILAYVCVLHDGQWRCGCADRSCDQRGWNLQRFASVPTSPYGTEPFPVEVAIPDIAVFYPSAYTGGHGTTITITGYGFDARDNTVIFRTQNKHDYMVYHIPAPTTRSLTVTVPQGIPYGVYNVIVEHTRGRSFNGAMFTVVRPGAHPPVITSVTPSEGGIGTNITLTGEHFAREGNVIYTGYGIISNVPSHDGKTLAFTFDPFPTAEGRWQGTTARRAEFKFLVANENGVTRNPASFTATF